MQPVLARIPFVIALVLAAGRPVSANPDVWVTTSYLFRMTENALTGLAVDWHFDPFASSFLFEHVDTDGDGIATASETEVLKTGILAELASRNWYLHLLADDTPLAFTLVDVEPVVEPERLAVTFDFAFDDAVDYRTTDVVASLHDREVFFDFSFAESDFLKVEGALDPSCAFVAGPGRGPTAGHFSTITLRCGDPP